MSTHAHVFIACDEDEDGNTDYYVTNSPNLSRHFSDVIDVPKDLADEYEAVCKRLDEIESLFAEIRAAQHRVMPRRDS